MPTELFFPAFIAGILMFLAPCTLPLIPGFLAFISGVSPQELEDPEKMKKAHWRIWWNGVLYVVGFSTVFILFGSIFGLGGAGLSQYQHIIARVGGVLIIFFGIYMLGGSQWKILSFLNSEKKFHPTNMLQPGQPISSFLFGVIFALGWSPCIGPILGTILLLASTTATAGQGAILLTIFALGLAIPFLILAASIGSAIGFIKKVSRYLSIISKIGGVFLILLGVLMLFDNLEVWNGIMYKAFAFINYDSLLDYL